MANEAAANAETAQDAATKGTYYFLDVGEEKYGECILVVFGDIRVLIDGSHRGDIVSRWEGRPSIPEQLAQILEENAPHTITLLVVTHGHADHIGCLPELLKEEIIHPEWALLTHRKLGFGRVGSQDSARDALSSAAARLAAALREEDASDLDDRELRDFIEDASSVEPRYYDFFEALERLGTKVIEYEGQGLPTQLKNRMRPTGMKLIGPSPDQLVYCAEQISTTNKDAVDAVRTLVNSDASISDVALYRAIVNLQEAGAGDVRNPRGNGMNCQSITLAFGPPGARVLLAGDMQFTEPGVKGADDEVRALRRAVAAHGPYKVFKTTHHTSHNGQDDPFLEEMGNPQIIVHSGGRRDSSHPAPSVLEELKEHRQSIQFARTDRNGLITVRPDLAIGDVIQKSRGRLNDFSPNSGDSEGGGETSVVRETPAQILEPQQPQPSGVETPAQGSASGPQIVIVNLPPGPVDMQVSGVDIVVRGLDQIAFRRTPQMRRYERGAQEAEGEGTGVARTDAPRLGAGRQLPRLLFVTNTDALRHNIGRAEARSALRAIEATGQSICNVSGDAASAVSTVRQALRGNADTQGVVLLGGYDVVPSHVVDVLGADLRRDLGDQAEVDDDKYIIWSDEPYGDTDEDGIGELPVSRIPDARDAEVLLGGLGGGALTGPESGRFGVRNVARPFADRVWTPPPGNRLKVSETFLSNHVNQPDLACGAHYFMLHGDWIDGRVFQGEYDGRPGYTRGFDVVNVPAKFGGTVFTGCCWGALTVSQKACDAGAAPLAPRVAERSIALSYIKAGACAFVGCTGSHYSGQSMDPNLNYAIWMHEQFWSRLTGSRASLALHQARSEYARRIAANGSSMDAIELAIRLKNRAQFTCLGLGW